MPAAAYLGAVVVHGQHAEHVQCVSTLDELAHSVGHGAVAPLHRGRRLVAGRIGQLVHADNAVLREVGTEFDLTKDQRGAFFRTGPAKDVYLIRRSGHDLHVALNHLLGSLRGG